MLEDEFGLRLAQLRAEKDVSARDMSLSIGQNDGYINCIENGKALPSMSSFFFICEYLNITPSEFFDTDNKYPEKLSNLIDLLRKLNDKQLESITSIVSDLVK